MKGYKEITIKLLNDPETGEMDFKVHCYGYECFVPKEEMLVTNLCDWLIGWYGEMTTKKEAD